MKKAREYVVYLIIVDDVIRYVGKTNDIQRRQREHNYALYNNDNKAYNKKIYKFIRNLYPNNFKIDLVEVFRTTNNVEAKRKELYLMLYDYFNEKLLKQHIPNISDRPFNIF